LNGGDFFDVLFGGNNANRLIGGRLDNALDGGRGNDTLIGVEQPNSSGGDFDRDNLTGGMINSFARSQSIYHCFS
jgi:Ca2+-binding RTX toxin-like protein